MKRYGKETALVALVLLCTGCANEHHQETARAPLAVMATEEHAAVRWEEVVAAPMSVKPSNSFLIMMR